MQNVRLESGAALAVCSGIQSGQLFETFGSSKENKTLVASQPARKLIKIGAKVVRHSRYVTFQMAEVAIDKRLFTKILSKI